MDEPASVRKAPPLAVSDADAWALFDRSVSSGYRPADKPLVVRFDDATPISALKAYGPAPYRVSARASDGRSIGLAAIDLSKVTPGWHTFTTDTIVATTELVMSFTPTGGVGQVPELEIWEVADDGAARPDSGVVTFRADTAQDSVEPGACVSFAIDIPRSPSLLRRTRLAYDTSGVLRSFSLVRTINGLGRSGGGRWLAADATRRESAERFDAELLIIGRNEVKLCAPADATQAVSISNLRIIGDLDRGTEFSADAVVGADLRDGTALVDRDAATSIEVAAGEPVAIELDRFVAPDALALSAGDVAAVACRTKQGTTVALAANARKTSNGTLVIVDGGRLACAALELTFASAATVAEVEVIGSGAGERVDTARVVVTSPKEHFGTFAWVGGYVTRPTRMSGAIRVETGGQRAEGFTGEFGTVLTRLADSDVAWPVAISARLPDGSLQTHQMVLGTNVKAQLGAGSAHTGSGTSNSASVQATANGRFGVEGDVVTARAATAAHTSVRLGTHVGVEIPAGSVPRPTNISVRHLGTDVLPPLDPGMINVTAPHGRGYEFLPHGITFQKLVEVVLPYDASLIPEGMKPDDVYAYYFDPRVERWKRLDRTSVDIGERITRNATNHFTIMINAVLTVPTNPSPLSLDPTALSSVGAASPAANVDMIQAPVATSTGDARLSLPIRLPASRGSFAVQLGIGYSSAAGNSWLGVGWDLQMPMSAIEIDTRWGVPRYASGEEPRYLLDGAELVPTLETEGPSCAGGGPQRRFRTRVEGAFAHVLRCGDEPWNFRWEVRDRNGTLMAFGARAIPNADITKASLRHPAAPHGILRWHLHEVTDVHGNVSRFHYEPVDSAHARSMYLKRIEYTTRGDEPAPYSVELVRDDGSRPDKPVNARGGFVSRTDHLLRAIQVRLGNDIIREYVLTYARGAFEKSVLQNIRVYGLGGCLPASRAFALPTCTAEVFHEHDLTYYLETTALAAPMEVPVVGSGPVAPALGRGHRTAFAGGLSGTLGLDGNVSASLGVRGSIGEREEQIGLYDLNGDSLPDQVYESGGHLRALYNQAGAKLTAAGPAIMGLPGLGREHHRSWSVDASVKASEGGTGASAAGGFANSTSRAKRFFADIDGDQFLDYLVAGGDSLAGAPCADATCFEFARRWDFGALGAIDPHQDPLLNRFSDEISERLMLGNPVVRWVAPYSGTIEVTGTAQKLLAGGDDGLGIELHRSRGRLVDELVNAVTIGAASTAPITFADATTLQITAGESLFVRLTTGADDGIAGNGDRHDEVDARLLVRYMETCIQGACTMVTQPMAREPTGEPVFEFDSQSEFRVAGVPVPTVMPTKGTIDIHGLLSKQVTPSDVRICVQVYPAGTRSSYLTGSCIDNDEAYTNHGLLSLFANERVAQTFDVTGLAVEAGDIVVMRVESEFSIDPMDVELFPRLDATPMLAYSNVCMPTGTGLDCTNDPAALASMPLDSTAFGPYLAVPPHPQIALDEPDRAPPLPFISPRAGRLQVRPFVDPNATGIGSPFAVRSDRQGLIASGVCNSGCCGSRRVGFGACQSRDDGAIPSFDVEVGESITIEIAGHAAVPSYTTDPSGATVFFEDDRLDLDAPLVVKVHALPQGIATPFAGGYRGWMYTLWNEPVAFEPSRLLEDYRVFIDENGVKLSDARVKELVRSAQAPIPQLAGRPASLPAPSWAGPGSIAYASATTLHAAQLGELTGGVSLTGGGGLFEDAYARLSGTSSSYKGANFTTSGISLGATVSESTTKTTTDVVDLNGDGILDVIAGEKKVVGAISPLTGQPTTFSVTEGFRVREGHDFAFNFGASAVIPTTTSSGRPLAATATEEPDTGLFFDSATGIGVSRTQTTMDLLDMNADGLPDKIWRDGDQVLVQYGLGDEFGPVESFGAIHAKMKLSFDGFKSTFEALLGFDNDSRALGHDTTITQHSTLSANFVVASASSTTRLSSTRTTRMLADINGDALPDLLAKHDNEDFIRVQLNLGDRFSTIARRWETPEWGVTLEHSFKTIVGDLHLVGGDVLAGTGSQTGSTQSAGVSVPIIPGVFSIGGDRSVSEDTDTYEMALLDFTGDGVADHVLRRTNDQGTSTFRVKANLVTGKSNLLKAVSRPLGGTITLDYERVGNTVEMPQSRYVLAKVEVDDGVSDLGVDFASPNIVTRMSYERGFYDRLEKEFFGFAKVTTRRADEVTVETEYLNDTYTRRGLLSKQTRRDGDGNVFEQRQVEYDLREVVDGSGDPIGLHSDCLAQLHPLLSRLGTEPCTPRFPVVVKEHDTRAEGGTLTKTRTTEDLAHDRFGNVLASLDRADDAFTTDDVYASATYLNDTTRWILGRTTSIDVRAGSATGNRLRKRSGTYDDRGNLVTVSVETGTGTATTLLRYTADGVLDRVTTPPNEDNETQEYEILELDPVMRMYPTRVADGFEYTSTATYDLRFGLATTETDSNGATLTRTLDDFGRLVAMRGPYDTTAAGIEIEYHLNEAKPRAVTVTRGAAPAGSSHLEAAPITTVMITDGVGDTVEMRTSSVVNGVVGMTTSGLVARDDVGRAVKTYYPFFTAGPSTAFVAPELTDATVTQYDALDRPIITTYADAATERLRFDLEPGPDGQLLFLAQRTAANGNVRETFLDHLGRTRAFVEHPDATTSAITRYDYLPTGELAEIVDAENNRTRLSHDLRGLRTTLHNPDTGTIEERYDLMGNRVALVEPNHRENGSAGVRFLYERNRLASIVYPSKPEVRFEYGEPGAPHGRAGRLVKVTDETGSREHFYGALGEVTRTIRVVAPFQPSQPSTTFDTKIVTDSLGRQLSVVYPDGATVTNKYDDGGMLLSVSGAGDGWSRVYVDDLRYDKFGHRIHARYGNGAVSEWTFDPKRVRLQSVLTTLGPLELQDLNYRYDAAGNPTSIENKLPKLNGGSGASPGNSDLTLTYDGVDRLKTASGTAALSAQKQTQYQQSFDYSSSHNLLAKQRVHLIEQPSGIPLAPSATNFASSYHYEASRPHLPNRVGDLLIKYDPSGNPTERRKTGGNVEQQLVWDDDNRLVSFSGGGVQQHNSYDADGLRVRRRGIQSETIFANPYFDLENGTQGVRHVFAGGVRVASELTRFESGRDPLPPSKQGVAYFFHQDHLQSTAVLTNQDGDVHESLEYFVDGEMWIDRGPQKPVNGYLFSGKPFDPDTGLYDFGQRFYDPRTSLWLGIDPALSTSTAETVGSPAFSAPSAFVAHNPARLTDPDGRQPREAAQVYRPTQSPVGAYQAWADRTGRRWRDATPVSTTIAPYVVLFGREVVARLVPFGSSFIDAFDDTPPRPVDPSSLFPRSPLANKSPRTSDSRIGQLADGPVKFANRYPDEPISTRPRYRLEERDGKWVTISASGTVRSATGKYVFITEGGTVYVDRASRAGHVSISYGKAVEYAGEATFGNRRHRGQLLNWNNSSGHYTPPPEFKSQARLPIEKFKSD